MSILNPFDNPLGPIPTFLQLGQRQDMPQRQLSRVAPQLAGVLGEIGIVSQVAGCPLATLLIRSSTSRLWTTRHSEPLPELRARGIAKH